MIYYSTDINFLEALRKELMELPRLWVYVVKHTLTGKGIKIEVKNDFSGDLNPKQKKDVEFLTKRLCKKRKVQYDKFVMKDTN